MPNVSLSMWGAPEPSSRRADRRKPGALGGFFDDGGNPGVQLDLGRAGALGNRPDTGADGAKHVAQHFEVQPELAAVVVVNHRLVDAGPGSDAVHASGVESALGELLRGGREDGALRVATRAFGFNHGCY